MNAKLYSRLATLIVARANCEQSGNIEWHKRHTDLAALLVRDYMPSGSGFDSGTVLLMDECSDTKLVFSTAFHHMDDDGSYDGWTSHIVRVRSSLSSGIVITVSGSDRNSIKDCVAQTFDVALWTTITDDEYKQAAARATS